MSLLRNLASGIRTLFRKEHVDRELDEELRAYQEMAAEEKIRRDEPQRGPSRSPLRAGQSRTYEGSRTSRGLMKFTTMSALVSDSIGAQRFRTALASIFAVLAVLLALSGMYAVVSYVTAQRTAEFGLRSALGAQQSNLVLLVLRGAAGIAGTGIAIGVLLSVAAGRWLSSMLFGVKNLDPVTYALVIAIVVPVILLASAIPLRRAMGVAPMVALRYE
jgi:predicted lysophospholipase L1 biosynthesis ABC-type transport system permease subunit